MGNRLAILCSLLSLVLTASLYSARPVQAGAFAPTPRDWTVVTKTSDTSRASTTSVTADPDLAFSAAASTKYRWRINCFFGLNGDSTNDIKWSLLGPASPTQLVVKAMYGSPGSTGAGAFLRPGVTNAYTTWTDVSLASSSATSSNAGGWISVEGILQNGSNAGSFQFGWSQRASSVNSTTVLAGSYLEYKAVP